MQQFDCFLYIFLMFLCVPLCVCVIISNQITRELVISSVNTESSQKSRKIADNGWDDVDSDDRFFSRVYRMCVNFLSSIADLLRLFVGCLHDLSLVLPSPSLFRLISSVLCPAFISISDYPSRSLCPVTLVRSPVAFFHQLQLHPELISVFFYQFRPLEYGGCSERDIGR